MMKTKYEVRNNFQNDINKEKRKVLNISTSKYFPFKPWRIYCESGLHRVLLLHCWPDSLPFIHNVQSLQVVIKLTHQIKIFHLKALSNWFFTLRNLANIVVIEALLLKN